MCIIFLDLTKAFDVISHELLLRKLANLFNFSESAINWISSYLSNRKQPVVFNNSASSFIDVNTGVPQGSVLGPLLFSMFINDINECLFNATSVLYADDSTLVVEASNLQELNVLCNTNLSNIYNYCQENRLKINPGKCCGMIVGPKTLDKSEFGCNIANESIDMVESTKYLGYHIDSTLCFKFHTDHVVAKLNSCSGLIYRLRKVLPIDYMYTIFQALGMSHIIYFSLLVTTFNKAIFKKLENGYKNAGCAVLNCTCSGLDDSNWPSLKAIILWCRFKWFICTMSG